VRGSCRWVEAIEQAKRLKPDLIVLDLVMPRMNGAETASVLSQTMPNVPVVLLTLYQTYSVPPWQPLSALRPSWTKQRDWTSWSRAFAYCYPVTILSDSCTTTGPVASSKCLKFRLSLYSPLEEMTSRSAMADPKSFVDNLKNLRLVMSVALEHMQENRNHFVKDATASQARQVEKSVGQIRTFADRIETEFNTLEYLIGKRPT
jgi:hypothetical protein